MSVFFDSNVLVYRFDYSVPAKQAVAKQLVDSAFEAGNAMLSTQCLQEFYHVATRKFRMPSADAMGFARAYAKAKVVTVSPDVVFLAMERHATGNFSFWDALIVESALAGGARVLYSEDMHDGLQIGPLTIRNPFAEQVQ